MDSTRVKSGMWRVDPMNRSRVVDRFGRPVAYLEPDVDASLIASAPDMFEVLQTLESDRNSVTPDIWEEIQIVLRRAKGFFGSAAFSPRHLRMKNQEWLHFIESLWKGSAEK